MQREIHKWQSPYLKREMELVIYGFYGYTLLLFPPDTADHLEYERSNLIESISPFIYSGALKCVSISSVNDESWLNTNLEPEEKALRHHDYNKYITEELVPFIYKECNGPVPILTAGVSFGAFNAANSLFRRPDLFRGVIGMSGVYDIKLFSRGYNDDNCYFNSPIDYLPDLTDHMQLQLLKNKTIIIACGQGAYEDPQASRILSDILHKKEIPHWLDLWGFDISHEWSTWKKMLPYYLENITI